MPAVKHVAMRGSPGYLLSHQIIMWMSLLTYQIDAFWSDALPPDLRDAV